MHERWSSDALAAEARALGDEVVRWAAQYASGACPAHDRARFEASAARLFALQRAGIAAYGRYVDARAALADGAGGPPPLLPVTALKRVSGQLACGGAEARVCFETSGTTDGAPGRVTLPSTRVYDAVLDAGLRRGLLARSALPGSPRWRVVSLVPDRSLRPHSSLGHMAERMLATLDDGGGGAFLRRPRGEAASGAAGGGRGDPQGELAGLDLDGLLAAVDGAIEAQRPVLLVATTLALGLLAERWPEGLRRALPSGSLVMDTGGPKGRRRVASRGALRAWLGRHLGVPADAIVGELGMTELASQRYELRGGDPDAARYVGPPWLRSVVLDPATLAPVALGEVGIVGHIDVANVETVAFLLTADLGRLHALADGREALELLGRVPGSEWRGCGLDVEALLPQ